MHLQPKMEQLRPENDPDSRFPQIEFGQYFMKASPMFQKMIDDAMLEDDQAAANAAEDVGEDKGKQKSGGSGGGDKKDAGKKDA